MLSEMSLHNVATVGHSFGFGETIDNHRSVVWIYGSAANNANGNIFTNNRIFSQTPSVTSAVSAVKFVSPAGRYQTSMQANQNTGSINDATTSKLSRYADTSAGNAYNNIYGILVNTTPLENEIRITFEIVGAAISKYMV